MNGFFAYTYVSIPRSCLMPAEVREDRLDLELQTVMRSHLGAGNQTSGTSVSSLNCWTTSAAPSVFILEKDSLAPEVFKHFIFPNV